MTCMATILATLILALLGLPLPYTFMFIFCTLLLAFSLVESFMETVIWTSKIPVKALDLFFLTIAFLSPPSTFLLPSYQRYMLDWLSIPLTAYIRLIVVLLTVIASGYFLNKIILGNCFNELHSLITLSTVTGVSVNTIAIFVSIVATGTLNEYVLPFVTISLAVLSLLLKRRSRENIVLEFNPVLSSLFLMFLLLLYASTMGGFIPFYDMWTHYAQTMRILSSETLDMSRINVFHAFLACLLKLSGFPEVNVFIILNIIGFLPALAFHTFVRTIKPSRKTADLATTLFSLSTSLSWILVLVNASSGNIVETIAWINYLVSEDFTKQNLQVFGSYYFSFTHAAIFMILALLLKSIDHRKLFTSLLVISMASFMTHPSEMIMLSIIVPTLTLLGWIREESAKIFLTAFTLSFPAIMVFASFQLQLLAPLYLIPIGYGILAIRTYKRFFSFILSLLGKCSLLGKPLATTFLMLLAISIISFNSLAQPLTKFSLAQFILRSVPWYGYMIKFGIPILALAIPTLIGSPLDEEVKTFLLATVPLLAVGASITLLKLNGFYIPYWEFRVVNFFIAPLIAISTSMALTRMLASPRKAMVKKALPATLLALVLLTSIPTYLAMTYYLQTPKISFEEAIQTREILDGIDGLRGSGILVLSYQVSNLLRVTGYGYTYVAPSEMEPIAINLLEETPDPIEFYWHISPKCHYLMLMEDEAPRLASLNSFLAYHILADENLVHRSSLMEIHEIPWIQLNYSHKALVISPLKSQFKTAILTSLLENGFYYDICPIDSISSIQGYNLILYATSPDKVEEAYTPTYLSSKGFNMAILPSDDYTFLMETLNLADKTLILDATANFTWRAVEGNVSISIEGNGLLKSIQIKGKTSSEGKLLIEIIPMETIPLTNLSTIKVIARSPTTSTKIHLKCMHHNYTFTIRLSDEWTIEEAPITVGQDTVEKIIVEITYPPREKCTMEIASIYATKQPETVKLKQVKHGDHVIEVEDEDYIEAFKLKGSYETLINGIDGEGNKIPILVKLPIENGSLYYLNLKTSTESNPVKLYKILKLALSEIASRLGKQEYMGIEHPTLSAGSIQCNGAVTIETDAIYIYPARIVQGLDAYETLLKESILNPHTQFKIKIAFNGTARIEPSEEINMVRVTITPKATITINNSTTITILENTTIKVKTPTITVKGTLTLNEKGKWLKTVMHITRNQLKITGTATMKITRSAKRIYIKTLNYTGTTATINPILQPLKENYITAYRIPELLLIAIITFTVSLITEIAILLRKLKKTLKAIAPDYRKK